MKKRNAVDEFIRIMEEAFRNIQEEGASVFIDVSIQPCQNIPQEFFARKNNNTSVDLLETRKNLHVLVGLPGVEEKDISLSCNGRALEIRTCEPGNTISETIELPAKVNKTGMKATFENGILEVVFNKSKKQDLKKNIN